MIPAEPPTESILTDPEGRHWYFLAALGEWVTLGTRSQYSGRSYPWAELVDGFGPLDVFVWRGTERVTE